MTHTSTAQPEALRLADRMEWYCVSHTIDGDMKDAAKELRRLHARVQELEASQAQLVPLSDAKVEELIHDKHFKKGCLQLRMESTNVNLHWYRLGLRDGEAAHGITQEKQG